MLLTLVVLCALAAVACLLVIGLGVAPFVVAVDAAERRGFSAARWGAIALSGTAAMLLLGFWVLHGHHSKVLLLPAAVLGWAGAGIVSLLAGEQSGLGGVPGAHER